MAEIYGVITFYSRFTLKPKGKYAISVCLGTACFVKGSEKIMNRLKERLGIKEGETTEDGKFSIDSTRCLGACGIAPVFTVNGEVYGKKYTKYLLLKIEYLMSDNSVHLSNYKEISIEHVLPQNPLKKSHWRRDFTENQRKNWTNKLSNLVLISNKKNVKLANLDFNKKKEEYLKHRMDVFNSSKIFLDKSSKWDEATLKSRQNTMVGMLLNNKCYE